MWLQSTETEFKGGRDDKSTDRSIVCKGRGVDIEVNNFRNNKA